VSRPGWRHGSTLVNLGAVLLAFVKPGRLGEVYGGAGCVLSTDPDTLRGPDVAFVAAERAGREEDQWIHGAPDIAVEIVSPHDRATGIARKTRQYLTAGARAVWIVYEDQIHVFEAGGKFRGLGLDDPLDAPEILPGFSITLRQILE
jgi:Uma2 family endonuclease